MAKRKPRAKAQAKTSRETKIGEAALRVATRRGWGRLTLDDVARVAKLPSAEMQKRFTDKDALLPAIVGFIDSRMLESLGAGDRRGNPQDRLFETFMARFDALQLHRRAITDIMEAGRRDPRMMRHLLPAQINATRVILDHTGLKPEPRHEPFVIAGLLGVYGLVLWVWRQDASEDMAKTMAALDRYLRHAVHCADILFRHSARL